MMLNWIKKTIIAGLLVLAPITLTIYIFILLLRFLDGLLSDSILNFIATRFGFPVETPIPGLGILALIGLLLITGVIARNYFGNRIIKLGNSIITRIPLINRIYNAIHEISEAILAEKREIFRKAVLIEYPRNGLYSIAFFTQDTKGPVQENLPEDVVSVFVPTTPNPTSGYLIFVPKTQITELDMSVEDAMKLVISGGSIHLKERKGLGNIYFGGKKNKPTASKTSTP